MWPVAMHRLLKKGQGKQGRRSTSWIRCMARAEQGPVEHGLLTFPDKPWAGILTAAGTKGKTGQHTAPADLHWASEQGWQLEQVCTEKVKILMLVAGTPIPQCDNSRSIVRFYIHMFIHQLVYRFLKLFFLSSLSKTMTWFWIKVSKTAAWGRYTWQKEKLLETGFHNGNIVHAS